MQGRGPAAPARPRLALGSAGADPIMRAGRLWQQASPPVLERNCGARSGWCQPAHPVGNNRSAGGACAARHTWSECARRRPAAGHAEAVRGLMARRRQGSRYLHFIGLGISGEVLWPDLWSRSSGAVGLPRHRRISGGEGSAGGLRPWINQQGSGQHEQVPLTGRASAGLIERSRLVARPVMRLQWLRLLSACGVQVACTNAHQPMVAP